MRKFIFCLTSLAVIAIGVILLVFNHDAYAMQEPVLRGTVIAGGIIFCVPGFVQLLGALKPKRDYNGNIVKHPWYKTAMALGSLLWGILMICMPSGFVGNFNITLGVSLVLAGLAQIIWFATRRKIFSNKLLTYAVPVVTVGAGIVVCTLRNDYATVAQSTSVGSIVAGIVMILWGLNTFFALPSKPKAEPATPVKAQPKPEETVQKTEETAKAADTASDKVVPESKTPTEDPVQKSGDDKSPAAE